MNKLFNIIYGIIVAVIIAIAGLLIVSMFPIAGNYEAKIVLSGSMEPAIGVGSVVIIKPEDKYEIGDIITFGKDTKNDIPTTHRIVEMRAIGGKILYKTKGDANSSDDAREVGESEVIGKVLFSIPYLGYLLDFAKKPIGFVLLIVIPAGIIIIDELGKIWRELQKMRKTKTLRNSISPKKNDEEE